ncbi:MAG: alpha/beta hydrolase [Microthrixaceae bacterium]
MTPTDPRVRVHPDGIDDVPVEESPEFGGLDLPMGERVGLPGRGETFFRYVEGPEGAPTVVLLHGWVASGGMNFFKAFEPLSKHFNVVAPDLRGHGRGIRSWRRFRLADCADDTAALIKHLDCGPAIVAGYSMGGPVAQLLWRRHPELVSGLVLAATGTWLVPGLRQQIVLVGMVSAIAGPLRLTWGLPEAVRRMIPVAPRGSRPSTFQRWAAEEMRRHDWRMVTEAGTAIATFDSRRWIKDCDVPTTVLVTTKDRAVSPLEQARTALLIPTAEFLRYNEGHLSPAKDSFGPMVTEACLHTHQRIGQEPGISTEPVDLRLVGLE